MVEIKLNEKKTTQKKKPRKETETDETNRK